MTQVDILNDARDPRCGGYKGGYQPRRTDWPRVLGVVLPPGRRAVPFPAELFAAVRGRAGRSRTRTADSAAIRVEADRDDAERLAQMLPGEDIPLVLTHWSFGHLAQELLAGSGWLPEPLRTPGRNLTARALTLETSSNASIASPGEGLASSGYETAMVGIRRSAEDESAAAEPHAVAAE